MAGNRLVRLVPAGPRLWIAILAVAVAYHFSLKTLAADWRYDTPLADLVLVPPLAGALLIVACRRHRYVAFLRLGRFDLVVAALLFLCTITLNSVGPILWSKYFWAARIDLLTLPLFAAAVVVLLFGARAIVPLAFPVLFLLLAWPLPYIAVLERALAAFTGATTAAVGWITASSHLAAAVPGSGGSRYIVSHDGTPTVVAIASACSGVNSLVGFGIVGIAALWLVRGRLIGRLGWLIAGATLVWALNVLRIVAVFLTVRQWGEHAAFDLLHPVAGIVALNLGFLLLLRLLPLFGLRRRRFDELEIVDTPLARAATPGHQATPGRIATRLALLVLASSALALANGQLGNAARGYDNTGRPALAAFVEQPLVGPGWSVQRLQRIRWAAQYYGPHSTWVRYRLRPKDVANGRKRFTAWIDAVLSSDLGALDAYTLAHCYAFHGFHVDVARRLDLGSGVIGQLFVYRTSEATWHAVAWQWPVLNQKRVDHERIVLLASTFARPGQVEAAHSGWLTDELLGYLNTNARNRDRNRELSRALTALGSQIVAARIERKAPA